MAVAVSGMASHLMSLFLAFNLLFTSTYGRELQKNCTNGTIAKIKVVSRATTGETNKDDVQGLIAIYNTNPFLLDFTSTGEDPCLPTPLTWIECNSDANPRVIAVDLHNRLLMGIPDFSTMDALQRIDLSQIGLTGLIPSFLGSFPDLQELNLNYNNFYGQIPDSIACNKKLKYSVVGNANTLTTSSSCSSSSSNKASPANPTDDTPTTTPSYGYDPPRTYRRKSKLPVILGSIGSLLVIVSAAFGIFAIFRHKAKTASAIAAASAPPPGPESSPSYQKPNMPSEERPMNSRPTNMSPGV